MDDAMLRADCTRCAALCCVALPFDRGPMFGFDKPAGSACRHLGADNRCAIHSGLRARGFAGCAAYDCLGAGQRVTQEILPGRSWRESPAAARAMFDAFRAMRQVHELLLLLRTAARLRLTPEQAARRAELEAALTPESWSPASLSAFERGPLPGAVRDFLAGLKDVARDAPFGPGAARTPETARNEQGAGAVS